jgi:GTPase SAR1 family protein
MVQRPGKINPVVPSEPTKIKVMIVGEAEVGKTSFCKGFNDDFPDKYVPTIGSDYYMKTQKTSVGLVQFNVFDTSADPIYLEVRNEFYKDV